MKISYRKYVENNEFSQFYFAVLIFAFNDYVNSYKRQADRILNERTLKINIEKSTIRKYIFIAFVLLMAVTGF